MQSESPILQADNRGFRYGDGLFETMKVCDEIIMHSDLHFNRLWSGLSLLHFKMPNTFIKEKLENEIILLCKKNNCSESARVRLSVFNGNGNLFDSENDIQYLIECWPLSSKKYKINTDGLRIDFFLDAKKSCDLYANLKSSSHLIYAMAARYSKINKLDDCFVLNTFGRIADTCIANVFLIKQDKIVTPPLTEGCIAGVMRGNLLQMSKLIDVEIIETPISVDDIFEADEIFITNAIRGINWIRQCGSKEFKNQQTLQLFNKLF